MGAVTKPRWRAYLYRRVDGIAKISFWGWVEYNTKRLAVNAARKCANDIYRYYIQFNIEKPVEETKSNGSVVFRIPGMKADRWPRVEPIE